MSKKPRSRKNRVRVGRRRSRTRYKAQSRSMQRWLAKTDTVGFDTKREEQE